MQKPELWVDNYCQSELTLAALELEGPSHVAAARAWAFESPSESLPTKKVAVEAQLKFDAGVASQGPDFQVPSRVGTRSHGHAVTRTVP